MVATHGRAMQYIHIRDKNPKGRSIMSKIGSREKMIINSHDSYSCPMYDDISQGGLALEARFHDGSKYIHRTSW